MYTFDEILDKIRSETEDKTKKRGDKFENLIKSYLQTDSVQKTNFKKIMLWSEYSTEMDDGIDIVGVRHDGTECAIQCKCWNDDAVLNYSDISTTYQAKDRYEKMNSVMIVFTGKSLHPHADKHFQKTGTVVITKDQLRESNIDWHEGKSMRVHKSKKPKDHQKTAINDVIEKFKKYDRGQLIMACGTGKTLISLHVAEKLAGINKTVLYVVPSIYLIPQAMREWSDNKSMEHQYVAVCSDSTSDRDAEGSISEVLIAPTTKPAKLKETLRNRRKNTMCVIFSTYNSLPIIKETQTEFDIVFFDEAHKTASSNDSYYTMGHSNSEINADKRLYMTATPRTYGKSVKTNNNVKSMDDESIFGPVFHRLRFSDAKDMGILVPFKITVTKVPEGDLYDTIKSDDMEEYDATINDMTKMYGAWKGITYPDGDEKPARLLQRVIVFHNRVNKSQIFTGIIKSKLSFETLVNNAKKQYPDLNYDINVKHIDGKTRSVDRGNTLNWLRDSDREPNTCRVVSNARCLQEGVDVPALDGIIFMEPRKSGVDIIQSIGRVMRKPENGEKKFGYVILPIAIPAGDDVKETIENNNRYKVVYDVLKAIVSHDDRLMALINQMNMMRRAGHTDYIPEALETTLEEMLAFNPGYIPDFVKSVALEMNDPTYYVRYGMKLGEAAKRIEMMILTKIKHEPDMPGRIDSFHNNLKSVVGDMLTRDDAIKALSQHAVLYRVFNMLFPDGFNNPISCAMETVIPKLKLKAELEEFEDFYKEVEKDMEFIKTPEERQEFIKTIYDSFLRGADKKNATKHGVVYTPVELIDFVIHSIDHVLKTEFDTSFADPNSSISVLDPFTGAGTFVARLLESGIIPHDRLYRTYKNSIYANEIMLLAYYVASVNIESTYQSMMRGHKYVPFKGISLTDTFDQDPRYRAGKEHRGTVQKLDGTFKQAHERVVFQKWAHLHVIMGNPPYSGGQKSANDDNKNTHHPELETRIKETYMKLAPRGNTRSAYNSYIKAFRWASDRIGKSGIIGLITPSSFIGGNSEAGLRACFGEEFTDIWCFNLRGDVKNKANWRKEGAKIFGSGSTEPIGITILVKNPHRQGCTIHYKNVGDYLTLDQKFETVKNAQSIAGITDWQTVIPNKYHDWVNQRGSEDEKFKKYMPMGDKDAKRGNTDKTLFDIYSNGLKSRRDAWVYNVSKQELADNVQKMINYCNTQDPDNFIIDPTKVAWTSHLSKEMKKIGKPIQFLKSNIRTSMFRPFIKHYLYFSPIFISDKALIPLLFPNNDSKNPTITVPDKIKGTFSALMTDTTTDLHIHEAAQCFPLRVKKNADQMSVGGGGENAEQAQDHSIYHNLTIIVPDKINDEFSVFITDMTPDLEVVHHGQCFPMRVME